MKIAFLVGMFPKLSETFILRQITGLLDLGHEVDIFCSTLGRERNVHPDVYKYSLIDRVKFSRLYSMPQNVWFRRFKIIIIIILNFFHHPFEILKLCNFLKYRQETIVNLYNFFHMKKFFLKCEYDIIHGHFDFKKFLCIRNSGVRAKYILSIHGGDLYYVSEALKQEIVKSADLYTYNSEFTKRRMLEFGFPPDRLKHLPVALDINRFQYAPKKIKLQGKIKFLTIARLVEKKGHYYALLMFSQLIKKYKNIEYFIAGDGPLKKSLLKQVRKLKLESYVFFLGAVDEEQSVNLYKRCHIFILPCVTVRKHDEEGQALVLQEAQACGLPVLSTFHNGIPEGVINEKTGFLVLERDVQGLFEKACFLIEHPEIWESFGQAGHFFVKFKYDVKILIKKLLEIYFFQIPN